MSNVFNLVVRQKRPDTNIFHGTYTNSIEIIPGWMWVSISNITPKNAADAAIIHDGHIMPSRQFERLNLTSGDTISFQPSENERVEIAVNYLQPLSLQPIHNVSKVEDAKVFQLADRRKDPKLIR